MKKLNVPDMHCMHCVKRITDALGKAKIKVDISLDDKSVTVAEADVARVTDILDDLGFEVK